VCFESGPLLLIIRSVPAADNAFEIVFVFYPGVPIPARNNKSERDQRFEFGFLQRGVRVSRDFSFARKPQP